MIKIYEIKLEVELSDDDKRKILDDHPEFETVENIESPTAYFHIGETSLIDAAKIAQEKALQLFPNGFKIISIEELEGMNIINWGECNCPYCQAEFAAPDDIIEFDCSCGEHLKVAEGWDQIECYNCDKVINRNQIIGSNGKYILIEAKNT